MIGIGADLIDVRRVARAYERFGDRFLARVYTDQERAYCMRRHDFTCALAGRFAAKEAVVKALSPEAPTGLAYREVAIHADGNRPRVELAGEAASLAAARGVTAVEVTISHEREYALAFAVAWAK
ncbi:MAG: holo-ACP synthase [Candidatus Coatesbacteria bacterium]|nr:MAG: holo-ACP synthase [Candidatus Coatesbacteria bacterium]